LFPLQKLEKAVHLTQFEILINPKNKNNFHHVLVYECATGFVPEKVISQECGYVYLPSDVAVNCIRQQIVGWAIGGDPVYKFPLEAGYRLSPSTKTQYLLVEIHYDNPDLKKDIVDNSGIRFYFTEKLRKHDLGLLTLGAAGNPTSLQIPPKSNKLTSYSTCYPKCTEKYIPDEGIFAVGALLHTHLAGRAIKTTLVRNGAAIKELFDNPTYDFNYQFLTDIEPVKLYKVFAKIIFSVYLIFY
jgi:hypothetical protein